MASTPGPDATQPRDAGLAEPRSRGAGAVDADGRELERVEQSLAASENRLALALEAAQLGFWDWNLVTGAVFYDVHWRAVLGIDPAQDGAPLDAWIGRIHPDDVADVTASVRAHLDGRTAFYHCKLRMRAREDRWIWVESRGRVVERARDGKPLRVVGVNQDVTARVEAETAARRANRALRTLTECRAAIVGAANEASLLQEVCRLLVEVGGYRLAWVGAADHGAQRSVRPAARAGHDDGYVDSLAITWSDSELGRGPTGTAIRERRPVWARFTVDDPTLRPWAARARARGYASAIALPLVPDGRQCFGAMSLYSADADAFDLDEVRLLREIAGDVARAIQALRTGAEYDRLAATLRQAEKMELVGQLTGGLAHDFNNVLGIVVANLDRVAALAQDGSELRASAEAALQAALRGRDLTRSLLNLARKRPLDVVVTELNARVRSLLPLLSHALGPKIALEAELAAADLPVLVDVGGFDTGLLNLVVNARDAMPAGGKVALSSRRAEFGDGNPPPAVDLAPGTYAVVEVRDTGSGIDAETLAHVFDPFFTTKPEGRGSGLGLPMVDRFCRAAGGALGIASTPGEGTAVTLYLPCSDAPVAPAEAEPVPEPAPRAAPRRQGRILVVDDEAALVLLATSVLEAEGHTVTGVATAEEAMAELRRGEFDVLFTDVMLSGRVDGLQLAHWARGHAPAMPIVLTSGVPLATETVAGLCTFLEKPFRIGQLAAVVAQALDASG